MLLDFDGLMGNWVSAGNTFPWAVGAGNTCRSFLFLLFQGGKSCPE